MVNIIGSIYCVYVNNVYHWYGYVKPQYEWSFSVFNTYPMKYPHIVAHHNLRNTRSHRTHHIDRPRLYNVCSNTQTGETCTLIKKKKKKKFKQVVI